MADAVRPHNATQWCKGRSPLEAILEEADSVPAQLFAELGVTEALREALNDYFARESDRRRQRNP
ncbi:MAG: hypothetical protein IT196_06920 [Acidimicrobiales bacterium]|nr:hypothetical protein [Acidimicrobiales bacterium]